MGNIRESARKYTLKVLTKIFRKPYNDLTEGFVELRDQQANDYVRDQIHQAKNGLMVSKWGTTELGTVCSLYCKNCNWGRSRRHGCGCEFSGIHEYVGPDSRVLGCAGGRFQKILRERGSGQSSEGGVFDSYLHR